MLCISLNRQDGVVGFYEAHWGWNKMMCQRGLSKSYVVTSKNVTGIFFRWTSSQKLYFPWSYGKTCSPTKMRILREGKAWGLGGRGPQKRWRGCSRPCMVCAQLFCFTSCPFSFPPRPLVVPVVETCHGLLSAWNLYFSSFIYTPSHPSGTYQNLREPSAAFLSQNLLFQFHSNIFSYFVLWQLQCTLALLIILVNTGLPQWGGNTWRGGNHVWTSSISIPQSSAWPQVVAWWWIDEWGKGPCASSEIGSKVEDVFDCW